MAATNKNEKFIITDTSSLNEVFKLFEDEEVDGELQLSEYGLQLQRLFESAVENRVSTLLSEHVGKIDQALDAYLEQEFDESVADIRKLCLLAVSEIGGPEAVDAFIKKVAALARAGALSASSSEWAQGSPDDSASNRDSIHGGGVAVRKENVEAEGALTEQYVDAISRTVRRR
jgi:hypothetical protein